MVGSKTVQGDLSVREAPLVRGDLGAGDAELDRIFLIHSVPHNVAVRASGRIPPHRHLEKQTGCTKLVGIES